MSPGYPRSSNGEVTSFEVIARYVEALGGRLDLVADFGDGIRPAARHQHHYRRIPADSLCTGVVHSG